MKNILTLAAVFISLSNVSFAEKSSLQKNTERKQKIASYYSVAEKAFQRGDKKATVAALRKALQLNPSHGPSRSLAIKLRKSGPSFKMKARQRQLASVVLPVIDFQDLPLSDALATLNTLVEEKSKQAVIPNFVIQDPSQVLQKKTVTLNMKNVPANVVLDYLMNLTHASARFDQYAITVRPLSK